jgi:hypothetical protein
MTIATLTHRFERQRPQHPRLPRLELFPSTRGVYGGSGGPKSAKRPQSTSTGGSFMVASPPALQSHKVEDDEEPLELLERLWSP